MLHTRLKKKKKHFFWLYDQSVFQGKFLEKQSKRYSHRNSFILTFG